MNRLDTETHCHCGGDYGGSDHCYVCGCEQYETGDCGHTHECGSAAAAEGTTDGYCAACV